MALDSERDPVIDHSLELLEKVGLAGWFVLKGRADEVRLHDTPSGPRIPDGPLPDPIPRDLPTVIVGLQHWIERSKRASFPDFEAALTALSQLALRESVGPPQDGAFVVNEDGRVAIQGAAADNVVPSGIPIHPLDNGINDDGWWNPVQ